jgi:hypothetical protein
MKTYKELKRQHLLKQITEEQYQKEKAVHIDDIIKQLKKIDVIIYNRTNQQMCNPLILGEDR